MFYIIIANMFFYYIFQHLNKFVKRDAICINYSLRNQNLISSSYMNHCIIRIFNRITHTFIQLAYIGQDTNIFFDFINLRINMLFR